MADIVPQELRDAPRGRAIERLYPIGVRDRMPLLVAVCVDGSLWQLDQQMEQPEWERLPSIPMDPECEQVAAGDYRVRAGKNASRPRSVEQALAHAHATARRDGMTVQVFRDSDGAKIASVHPDGQIDMTWEGSRVA